MRKIKFRAWDPIRKRMVTKGLQMDYEDEYGLNNAYDERERQIEDTIYMQFIGLKDRNGKEIYNGDILDWDNECTILIKWNEEQAGFYYEELTSKDEYSQHDIRFYRSEEVSEIIGNVHENPELLESAHSQLSEGEE